MEIDSLFTDEPYAAGPAQADHRPRQAAYVVAIMVLALVASGLGVGWLYSARDTQQWHAVAEQRASDLAQVRGQREVLRLQLEAAQAALAASQEDLAGAQARIEEVQRQVETLTAEKATMLDKATFLPAALAMATELAQSVGACAVAVQPETVWATAEPGASERDAAEPDRTDPANPEPARELAAVAASTPGKVAPALPLPGFSPCDQAQTDTVAFARWLESQ